MNSENFRFPLQSMADRREVVGLRSSATCFLERFK